MKQVQLYLYVNKSGKQLEQVLDSILQQSYQKFILYIFTRENDLLHSYAKRDTRIVLMDPTEKFLKDFSGNDYICILNEMGIYASSFLEEMLKFMESNYLDIGCCGIEINKEKDNPLQPALHKNLIVKPSQFAKYLAEDAALLYGVGTRIYRGAILQKMELSFEEFSAKEDIYFMIQAMDRAKKIGFLGRSLLAYIQMPDSDPVKAVTKLSNMLEEILHFLKTFRGEKQKNISFLYMVYAQKIHKVMVDIFVPGKYPVAEQLEIVAILCNNINIQKLAEMYTGTDEFQEYRQKCFTVMLDWLLSLQEVPEGLEETFFKAGEFVCTAIQYEEGWIFFQKQRILFLEESGHKEEAINKLLELGDLVPSDDFVKAYHRKLDTYEYLLNHDKGLENFPTFLRYLKQMAQVYTVIVVGYDTPWGQPFTKELTKKFQDIGFQTDLYGRFRCGYGAVLDEGNLIFEQISPDSETSVIWSGNIEGNDILIESRGYGSFTYGAGKIVIEGVFYKTFFSRGLGIVIYDKKEKKCIDSLNFDTWDEGIPCSRKIELKHWMQSHQDIKCWTIDFPQFPRKELTENEEFMVKNFPRFRDDKGLCLIDHPKHPLRKFYSETEDLIEVLSVPKSYHDINGARHFDDTYGKMVNTLQGHRITTDQPEKSVYTIFLVGNCVVFGVGSSDKETIASYLQRLINIKESEHYVVQNYGYFLCEGDRNIKEELCILESLPIKTGDIVIQLSQEFVGIPHIDLSKEGERPHNWGEIFFDVGCHLTPDGNRMIAHKIYEHLKAACVFEPQAAKSPCLQKKQEYSQLPEMPYIPDEKAFAELREYKTRLCSFYEQQFSVGAIVMNCNPFTLGHRYLIEQACKQCGHLLIFVVEENRSLFPFAERLALVKANTEDLPNVTVLPSGKFMISSLTFSEYFNKSELQERSVDTSLDVSLFAKEIAPCLHITKRFVGQEPFDTVTQQYNQEMKHLLPQYGIQLVELPRLELLGEPVSASRIRECLEKQDFNTIKQLVPPKTYSYLIGLKK